MYRTRGRCHAELTTTTRRALIVSVERFSRMMLRRDTPPAYIR